MSALDLAFTQLLHATLTGTVACIVAWIVIQVLQTSKLMSAWTECWMWRLVLIQFLLSLLLIEPVMLTVEYRDAAPMQHLVFNTSRPATGSDQNPVAKDAHDAELSAMVASPDASRKVVVAASAPRNAERANFAVSRTEGWDWPCEPQTHFVAPDRFEIKWKAVAVMLWAIGFLVAVFRLLRQLRWTAVIACKISTDRRYHQHCVRIAQERLLPNPPRAFESDAVHGPCLMGFFRPAICIPTRQLTTLDHGDLELVVRHEIEHVRRRDLAWELLAAVIESVFFFHPLARMARSRMRVSCECACDESVVAQAPDRMAQYASLLLSLGTASLTRPRPMRLELGFGNSLQERMVNLQLNQDRTSKRLSLIGLVSIASMFAWVLPVGVTATAERQDDDQLRFDVRDDSLALGRNMDFEEESQEGRPLGWGGGGSGYGVIRDDQHSYHGNASARIAGASKTRFGSLVQSMDAERLRGKRIEYSAFLRSDVQGTGGLWMRIDGGDRPLRFDNMADRRLIGASGWTRQQIVLDVPQSATRIVFGALMTGVGSLWVDQADIRVVSLAGQGPKTTNMLGKRKLPTRPQNGGFDKPSRTGQKPLAWGGGGRGYELARDTEVKVGGKASGRIRQIVSGGRFGAMTQGISAKRYRGERVELRGLLKAESVSSASLWMRIDDARPRPLAFDNMSNRQLTGTADWSEHSIVLDVPETAENIAFGFLVSGSGTAWADNLKLRVVDESVPVTDMLQGVNQKRNRLRSSGVASIEPSP